jgi:hypothetical protein
MLRYVNETKEEFDIYATENKQYLEYLRIFLSNLIGLSKCFKTKGFSESDLTPDKVIIIRQKGETDAQFNIHFSFQRVTSAETIRNYIRTDPKKPTEQDLCKHVFGKPVVDRFVMQYFYQVVKYMNVKPKNGNAEINKAVDSEIQHAIDHLKKNGMPDDIADNFFK